MTNFLKRSVALLLMLVISISMLPVVSFEVDAAQISYVTGSDGYIYNWGEREEVATFLSPNAEAFYENNGTSYDLLISYAGGTNVSTAPSSPLYDALQDLMVDAHDYINSYDASRPLFQYTDCQNSGGKISSFYSGKEIGPSWDGGSTWNREHTWPNSKGIDGSAEDDIMMLRPTSVSENSSRGNKAYGESSGFYNPNAQSGGVHDLRGDVARIFLYIYVRWGNVNGNSQYGTVWGSNGVIESLELLLRWIEEDPVDTWELGRNDSVESITGTRNVFVDYPEFAFLLFGEEIPADMTTPSGEAGKSCGHNNFGAGTTVAATCTTKGYVLYVCQTTGCGYSKKTNVVDALGHSYTEGTCTRCGEAEPVEPAKPTYVTQIETGKAYKLGLYSTAKAAEYYFIGTMSGYYGATATEYESGVDVYVEATTGGYHLYFNNTGGTKQYINLVYTGTHYNFTFANTASSVFTWDAEKSTFYTTVSGELCYMGTYDNYVTFGVLQSSKYKDSNYLARLYTFDAQGDTPSDNTCQHNYTSVVTPPTCTKAGYTTYTCSLCNDSYKSNTVAATGHSYDNGACTVCGAAQPTNTGVTISFADTANRTVFSTSQQVWQQNGITVTNNKTSSSSNIADYSNPIRFYKNSELIISYSGITKIEINCAGIGSEYVTPWLTAPAGATATKDGSIVTIVFATPVDSVTYAGMSAQARANSFTVYAEGQSTACTHANTKVEGAQEATCSANGHTGQTVCTACGEVISYGESIPMKAHTWADANCTTPKKCSVCGKTEGSALGHAWIDATETAPQTCTRCGATAGSPNPGPDGDSALEAFENAVAAFDALSDASLSAQYEALYAAALAFAEIENQDAAKTGDAYKAYTRFANSYNQKVFSRNADLKKATYRPTEG